jgi:glucokinase
MAAGAGERLIVAGDIGGTKTVLGLFELEAEGIRLVREEVHPSGEYQSLEQILALFLGNSPPPLQAGCFGVAGPVLDGESRTTNLPWHLSEKSLQPATRAGQVKLLNDLEAMAYGMLFLAPEQLVFLQGQAGSRKGNIAVVAAGTGLGEAILYWDGARYHPIATEGGHTDFAPRTDQEVELLRYLRKKIGGRVSCERVLSGPGFLSLYEFLRDQGTYPEPPWLAERLQSELPPAVIAEVGLAGQDPLCVATLELFVSLYGAEAGNLALKCLALGGVYIGGGIAPKLLPVLQRGPFLEGLTDKGRFRDLMRSLPVAVSLEPRTPLLGAAHYAARLANGTRGA